MDITFSNNSRSALIALIAKEFHSRKGRYLGRTHIQKICYFVQEVGGVPLGLPFRIHYYGPYSDELTYSLDLMLADDVLKDKSKNPDYSNFQVGPTAGELLNSFKGEIRKYGKTIRDIASALGGLKPESLELLSTLYFCWRQDERQTRAQILKRFHDVKGVRFGTEEVESALDGLVEANLIRISNKPLPDLR